MPIIKKYQDFKTLNEEFVGDPVKGTLSKLSNVFSSPFKDMSKDYKDIFKDEDPSTIKAVIFSNFDQAIDAAKKEINNLKDDASIVGVIDIFTDTLVQLASVINKDIESAIDKDKSKPVTEVSRAIIIGNKDINKVGIVGLIDPQKGITKQDVKFKYSKSIYQMELAKGKDLKAKQQIAIKFFDSLQKEVRSQIDKDFNKEELDKFYNKIKSDSGIKSNEMTYDKLKEFYDKKQDVLYLLKGKTKEDWDKLSDDQKKKPGEKPASDIVGVKKISNLNDQDKPDSVVFNDKNDQPTIKKSYAEVLGPAEGMEEQRSEEAKQAAQELGKIKSDPDKMKKVADFAKFLQDERNKGKVAEIENLISGGRQTKEA